MNVAPKSNTGIRGSSRPSGHTSRTAQPLSNSSSSPVHIRAARRNSAGISSSTSPRREASVDFPTTENEFSTPATPSGRSSRASRPPSNSLSSSVHRKAARRNSAGISSSTSPPREALIDFPTTKNECQKTPTAPKKKYQMGSSSAKHAKECATPPVPPKKYQLGSSSSKHAKELKILTETIEALALKLKSAEERLVEAVMDNKSMSICMKDLKSSLEVQEEEKANATIQPAAPPATIPTTPTSGKKVIDPEEFRKVRLERDSAMAKAGEMSVTLAECRADTDELRDQLAAVTKLLQQQNCNSVPPSPMCDSTPGRPMQYLMSPGPSLKKNLANLWGNTSFSTSLQL
jgi:uncharacterized coiled-coil protein SlyX